MQGSRANDLIFQWLIYVQRNCPRHHAIIDSADIYKMSALMELSISSERDSNQTIPYEYIRTNQITLSIMKGRNIF